MARIFHNEVQKKTVYDKFDCLTGKYCKVFFGDDYKVTNIEESSISKKNGSKPMQAK
jgi:hypothetical protein